MTAESPPQRLLLVDAGSVYHPAYHVLAGFATRDGFPTGAIYGFVRTVLKLLREYPASHVGVAFDAPGVTHRHRTYERYKAQRPSLPDDLAVQIPVIEQITDALGLARFAVEGYEADDLIATLAQKARERGWETWILTGDKDLMQLVGEGVYMLKPGRQPGRSFERFDAARVEDYLGVPPRQVVDFLALVGDSTDNVPGVPGIGAKTAQALLAEFESLEDILAHLDRVPSARARSALGKHGELARLSRELVTLKPVDLSLEACRRAEVDTTRLKDLFERLEFRSLLREFDLFERESAQAQYQAILDEKDFEILLKRLKRAEEFSLDLETTSQDERRAEIVGVAISFRPFEGYYIPLAHEYEGCPRQLDRERVLAALKPFLEGETRVIGQNLKYDAKVLRRYGIFLRNIAFDALLASYLLDPGARQHNLDAISERFLGYELIHFKDLGQEDFRRVPVERATAYAAEDAEVVYRLKGVLLEELREKGLDRLFTEVELPLVEVLVEMELFGILLDPEVLAEQGRLIAQDLDDLRKEMFTLAGEEFNPNSPKQVAHLLFEVLKLPVIKRTKTGPSTDALVLSELALHHPLPGKIVEYRELEKLMNTYIEKLPQHRDPRTGRVYTSFNQTVTATGRLSSSDPNLQNIPVRTEIGGEIRRAFIAPPGRVLLAADYSQIELRVLAHLSKDEALIRTFRAGEDLHARTACEIFGVKPEDVDPYMRTAAKRVNFGILYGISAFRLAKELKIPHAEAQRYIDRFFEIYPGVKRFVTEQIALAEAQGYVTTLLGRRRYLPDIRSRNPNRRRFDQRNAVNAPIQGSAADIMKLAMIRVHERIREGKVPADMLLQVHDELVFEVDEDRADSAGRRIQRVMESVMELEVPLKVDIKVGHNWGEI